MLTVEEKPGAAGGGSVGRRRRRWSEAQKRQIVAETHEPGVSVPMVAQRYMLGRIAGTPQSRLDELLPWNWVPEQRLDQAT